MTKTSSQDMFQYCYSYRPTSFVFCYI